MQHHPMQLPIHWRFVAMLLAFTVQDQEATPVVTSQHILEALGRAHPSIPPAERRRLEAVYDKFSNNRDPNIGSADRKGKGKQLATLA